MPNPHFTPSELLQASVACLKDPYIGCTVSTATVNSAVELITALWKHAKPNSLTDSMGMQRSRLPGNRDTNGQVWIEANDRESAGEAKR